MKAGVIPGVIPKDGNHSFRGAHLSYARSSKKREAIPNKGRPEELLT